MTPATPRRAGLTFELGLKTDPILYRYSYDWLFKLLSEEGVRHVQVGTFFEMYDLPDAFFADVRRRAADHGIAITSVFTAHRELGGFFRDDGPGWVEVARKNFERLIDAAALMGATSVGSNPGAVLRDRMGTKSAGTKAYLTHFKELMRRAGDRGIEWLTIEPMSCLAEPPTLPDEMAAMQRELQAHHASHPGSARPGYCVDVAHGYADASKQVICDHFALMRAGLAMTSEVHLKNTDAIYNSTFGFTPADVDRGIIDVPAVRKFYADHADQLPVTTLIGYLEVGGPKLGRDYSDEHLGDVLRQSLQHLRKTWLTDSTPAQPVTFTAPTASSQSSKSTIKVAPSLMCADLLNLESHLAKLRRAGMADLLHLDVMDGRFAPNLTLGLTLIEQLRPVTDVPLDVHLMVDEPAALIPELIRIGVDRVSVHVEAVTHLDRTLNQLRDAGIKAGVAINPATPLSSLDYVLDSIDFVVLMTVNPGFAGQKLVKNAMRKIADCRAKLAGRDIAIQVDGNVSFANIPAMVAAGADELVAGTSSVFSKAGSLSQNADNVRAAIAAGISQRA
jgi:ribulose-phosphate 3-epimerase